MEARDEPPEVQKARDGKRDAILILLGKLAVHYYRPDFTEGQARQLYADYLDDLLPFPLKSIENAMASYRQDGRNKFFPTSGALIDAMLPPRDPSVPDRETTRADYRAGLVDRGKGEVRQMADQIANGGKPLQIAHQSQQDHSPPPRQQYGDSRPILWWMQPKTLWKAHWLESEVPYGEKIKDKTGGPLRDVMAP